MRTFEINGVIYKSNESDTYFYKSTGAVDKKGNPAMMRISRVVFEKAYEEWVATEEGQKAVAEKKTTKKSASKPRRSKDIAFEGQGVTLTKKQVRFIERMPEDDFYEAGLESTLWIDVYCDTLADEFNPMAVGAMVSTLREKGVIYVMYDRVNGKKCKFFGFTELGKEVAKELGLN